MRKSIFKKLEAQGLITNYNHMRKNLPPKLPERVFIYDETLWEGAQTPAVFLTYVEKVKLAKMMDEMGVAFIEVGFPGLSEQEKTTVKKIANEGFQQSSIAASSRILKSDVDTCLDCGIRDISITTAYNGLQLQNRLKMKKGEALQKTVESVEYAKKHGARVNLVLEDGSRTPLEDMLEILEATVKVGADRLVIADTVGFLRPLSMRYLISHLRDELNRRVRKQVPLAVHCHNDFGLATANTLAAVEEGVTYLHTCIAGFGQRAGCAPLEEVATALELLYDLDTGVDLGKLYRLSQMVEKAFAMPIQFHKPIIGENAFSYEMDENTKIMLSNPIVNEPFPPEIVGRETTFHMGKQTGKRVVEDRLKIAEINATPAQVDEIVKRIRGAQESLDKGEAQMTFYQVKKLMKEMRKNLTEEEFWRIVEQVTRQKPKLPQPPGSAPTQPSH
jgi:isopropylmalate/homocitrate/citramalate synthase